MATELITKIVDWILSFWAKQPPPEPLDTPPEPQNATSTPSLPSKPPTMNPDELLPWNTTESLSHENWHNVRALCDLEGLPYQMKEELCATVWGESEFNTHARLDNKDKNGRVWSTDWGICQWNSYWHGSEITPAEAVHDPEKAVRLMCKYFLNGQAKQWVAYSSGRYKKFLGKKL